MHSEQDDETVKDAEDLTDSDEMILDALHAGPRTKGALVDETGLHRNTVGYRLDVLDASDVVRAVHEPTALYELSDDPRPDAPAVDVDLDALRADLRRAVERREWAAVEDAAARVGVAVDG